MARHAGPRGPSAAPGPVSDALQEVECEVELEVLSPPSQSPAYSRNTPAQAESDSQAGAVARATGERGGPVGSAAAAGAEDRGKSNHAVSAWFLARISSEEAPHRPNGTTFHPNSPTGSCSLKTRPGRYSPAQHAARSSSQPSLV